jgi:hypothetical protein
MLKSLKSLQSSWNFVIKRLTLYPMSKRIGGAENANDRLSSNSCLSDVVVGISSSKPIGQGGYLRADWRVGTVLIRCFYEWAWPYNVFIKIIRFKRRKSTELCLKSWGMDTKT